MNESFTTADENSRGSSHAAELPGVGARPAIFRVNAEEFYIASRPLRSPSRVVLAILGSVRF